MVDVNEPLSRAFTINLRFLQLGLQLMLAQLISKIANTDCSTTLITIGLPISYILIAINIISILLIRWKQLFNRKIFFAHYAVNIILAGVAMVVGLGGIGEPNSCANNRVLHKYVGFQSLLAIILSVITLFGPFDWALRYTNAPGNLVWPFLFFLPWESSFQGSYVTVGILTLLTTVCTFVVNALPLAGGLTVMKKKIIHSEWIAALVTMGICEIIVFATYIAGADANSFIDFTAKKLAQTYLPINLIDALFWIWGLMTLKYTSGDTVRENIMKQDDNSYDENDLDHQQNNQGVGTLRR
jgi:hypothetical protein